MFSSLNSIVGNGKRFMAYEIIKRLEQKNEIDLLEELYGYVTRNERKKGQRHKVFEESFDAKECYSRKFILQKLGYMHNNPIAKNWHLVEDIADYPHSSASFYERGIKTYNKLIHVGEVW